MQNYRIYFAKVFNYVLMSNFFHRAYASYFHSGQLTGVKVVDEKTFIVKGGRAQPLLWKEHSFGMYIPKDALSPNETCFVTVKAVVGGLFQFPEGTKPVSAVYAISLSKQLRKPARMEMQHCVKLKNPEDSKFMSFAVASQSPSSMPYQFQEVSDGIFEKNSFFGSVNRQQFSFMTIIWKLLGYNGNYKASKGICWCSFITIGVCCNYCLF